MKYKNIVELVLITVIIASLIGVSFVLAGDGTQQERGLIFRIENLEGQVADLQAEVATLESFMATHTHDYSELTGTIPSHTHDASDITGVIDADTLGGYEPESFSMVGHTHDYSELTGTIPSHTHDYSEITNTPSIPTETDIIALIVEYAITREPNYDSGWCAIEQGEKIQLYHGLGIGFNGDAALVYMIGRDADGWHHQTYYGTEFITVLVDPETSTWEYWSRGVYWYLGSQSIWVWRGETDDPAHAGPHPWAEVRVMIWQLSP